MLYYLANIYLGISFEGVDICNISQKILVRYSCGGINRWKWALNSCSRTEYLLLGQGWPSLTVSPLSSVLLSLFSSLSRSDKSSFLLFGIYILHCPLPRHSHVATYFFFLWHFVCFPFFTLSLWFCSSVTQKWSNQLYAEVTYSKAVHSGKTCLIWVQRISFIMWFSEGGGEESGYCIIWCF